MTTMTTRTTASAELAGMIAGESMGTYRPVTVEEKIIWLSRARGIKLELEALQETKRGMRQKATATTASYSAIVVSGSADPHKYDGLALLAASIKERENELRKTQAEITKAIGTVKDSTLRTLLHQRYVNCKHWHEVAADIHYSEPRTHSKHKQALKEIRITRGMIDRIERKNGGAMRQ